MVRNVLIANVVYSICLTILLFGLGTYQFFHTDEANWSRVSIFSFQKYFIERDWNDPGWLKSFGAYGKENPQVGKYIMGLSLWLHGYRTFEGFRAWNHGEGLQWNIEAGNAPSTDKLFAARLPIALLSAATAALIYLLITQTLEILGYTNWPVFAGLIGSGLFMLHPAIWQAAHRAKLDMPAAFFSVLAIYLSILSVWAIVEKQFRKAIAYSLLGAVVSGLAIATKLNAVYLLLFAPTLSVLTFIRLKQFSRRTLIPIFSAQLILPWIIFILVNPSLQQSPLAGIRDMILFGQSIAERASRNYSEDAIPLLSQKWASFVEQSSGSLGNLHNMLGYLDLLLVIVGTILLITIAWKSWALHPLQALMSVALLLWALFTGVMVFVSTPMAWNRYYIPWLVPALLIEGITLTWLMMSAAQYLSQKITERYHRQIRPTV